LAGYIAVTLKIVIVLFPRHFWQDIDWLDGELRLERAVVKQIEGDVKTVHSSKPLAVDPRILELLKQHKQKSAFTAPGDWIFASPEKHGNLPRSYTSFWGKVGKSVSGCRYRASLAPQLPAQLSSMA
jgi:hypothetical protein